MTLGYALIQVRAYKNRLMAYNISSAANGI